MAQANYRPTLRTRRLSAALRELREAAGKTVEGVASELQEATDGRWSRQKVSRMERGGFVRPNIRDIRDLLDIYEVDAARREALLALARAARERGWWMRYADVWPGPYLAFEAEASRIRTWEPTVVPGLLQTARYATALFEAEPSLMHDGEAVELRAAARMERQRRVLDADEPPRMWAIIDEAALQRPVGGHDVMREQIAALVEWAVRPNVTLQVIPVGRGAHPGNEGSFVVLDFADDDDAPVVYLGTAVNDLLLERPEEIGYFSDRFDHLMARAEGPPETLALLRAMLERLDVAYDPGHDLRGLEPGDVEDVEPEPREQR